MLNSTGILRNENITGRRWSRIGQEHHQIPHWTGISMRMGSQCWRCNWKNRPACVWLHIAGFESSRRQWPEPAGVIKKKTKKKKELSSYRLIILWKIKSGGYILVPTIIWQNLSICRNWQPGFFYCPTQTIQPFKHHPAERTGNWSVSQIRNSSEKPVTLTKKEFDLLIYFLGNKNRVLSKSTLAEHLSGDFADMLDNHDFVYAHVKNLKKKLTEAGCDNYLRTVYGTGYKWESN